MLPVISTLLERILADPILEYVNKHEILSDIQHGYRKFHSTTTSLIQITEELRKTVEKKEISGILALDLSNAFDTISHSMLLKKLKNIGFGERSLLIMNYQK